MSPSGIEDKKPKRNNLVIREVPELTKREIQKFWSEVDILDEFYCWEWRGQLAKSWKGNGPGYGWYHIPSAKVTMTAHRISYSLVFGKIPFGLVIDHIECDNPPCVNPYHLKAVTHKENISRPAEKRTHCKNGHLYEDDNIYIRKDNGSKACKKCRNQRQIEYNIRKRERAI